MNSAEIDFLSPTEQENPRSSSINQKSTLEIVRLMNSEDAGVAEAVERVLPDVARAVDGIVERIQEGGHLFYVGTGTSGRLGVLDASECPPTFGVDPSLVQGIIAGGYEACYRAVEASEDDAAAGQHDLVARGVGAHDAVVGIAASGRTPYTVGAVEHARSLGSLTVAVTCAPESPITRAAEISIVPVVGPEVIAGSTRLKAGTAQKMVLNMLSTATMIRCGYTTGNRMSNLLTRNTKLKARAVRILSAELNIDEATAQNLLASAKNDLRAALVIGHTDASLADAEQALTMTQGRVEQAITTVLKSRES